MRSFLFSVSFLLVFSIHALAQPGTLDQSFGNGGNVITDFADTTNEPYAIAIQSDGKFIVGGYSINNFHLDIALVRYNSEGSTDNTFGNSGKITTDIMNNDNWATSILILQDQKILVSGVANNGNNIDIVLVKYKPNGSIDSTFGTNGITVTDIDGKNDYSGPIKLLNDNKFLMAGTTIVNGKPQLVLIKYDLNGLIDNSFGANGKVFSQLGDEDHINCLLVQNEKIIVGGYTLNGSNSFDFVLARYNSNGEPDNLFGTNGKTFTDFSNGSLDYGSGGMIQSDGKIVLIGTTTKDFNADFGLVRYDLNGNIDNSFGTNGKVTTAFGYGNDFCSKGIIQPDGKIILVGGIANPVNMDFGIAKYKLNGSLDSSFGVNGRIISSFGEFSDIARTVDIQPDAKILVVGSTNDYSSSDFDFIVARYNNDIVLPITLSSFTASEKQNSVLLNWQTASESNNSYFAIERSNNNSNFKEVGKVNSKGNSSQTQQYSFEDYTPVNGANYYRLKQVNKDGSSTTSKTVLMDFSKAAIIRLYPNPVKNIITIEGLTGKKTTVSIIDLNGRVLTTTSTNDATYTWNIKALPQGTYYLRTEADKKVNTVKFVKE